MNICPTFSSVNCITITDVAVHSPINMTKKLIFIFSISIIFITVEAKSLKTNEILKETKALTEKENPVYNQLSSMEKTKLLDRGFEKMIQLINIVGQLDQYISERTKEVIRRLSLLTENDQRRSFYGKSLNIMDITQHIQLIHYKQRYNWDCGVSCVLMVLPLHKRNHLITNFTNVCKEEGFNRSTWTIDLCYLLLRYGIRHKYFTITFGVHPGYYGHTFYDKIIKKDEDRINRRFCNARSLGLQISCTSVPTQRIIEHLECGGPVIVLANARQLRCVSCKINKLSAELRQCLPWPPSYQGHYIVLCGYDKETQRIFYRNPSLNDHVCCMSYVAFNNARQSYGTDEDIIFIYSN